MGQHRRNRLNRPKPTTGNRNSGIEHHAVFDPHEDIYQNNGDNDQFSFNVDNLGDANQSSAVGGWRESRQSNSLWLDTAS
jgi:hypothetical protein